MVIMAPLCVLLVSSFLGGEPEAVPAPGKAHLGKLPPGWVAAQTGEGKGSVWKVSADTTAPSKKGYVLTQTAPAPTKVFNLCVLNQTSFRDGEISVMFKSLRGDVDQGGGVVWRYK